MCLHGRMTILTVAWVCIGQTLSVSPEDFIQYTRLVILCDLCTRRSSRIFPVVLSPDVKVNVSLIDWVQIGESSPSYELDLEISHHPNCSQMFTYNSHDSNCGLCSHVIQDLTSGLCQWVRVITVKVGVVCIGQIQSHLCAATCYDILCNTLGLYICERVLILYDFCTERLSNFPQPSWGQHSLSHWLLQGMTVIITSACLARYMSQSYLYVKSKCKSDINCVLGQGYVTILPEGRHQAGESHHWGLHQGCYNPLLKAGHR